VSELGSAPVDVVVVGAGLAGLTAASRLRCDGRTVRVLEASDRVGGRVLGADIGDGEVIELGGQFLGPTQDHILGVVDELGLARHPTYMTGQHLFHRHGSTVRYDAGNGPIPPVGEAAITELLGAVSELEDMAASVAPDAAWLAPKATEWDALSFAEWVGDRVTTDAARALVDYVTRGTMTCEPSQLSLLHMVSYIAAAGNDSVKGSLGRVIVTADGASMYRVVGGSQRIPQLLADPLGDVVSLSSPVERLTQHDNGVTAYIGDRRISAQRAIVAVPPVAAGEIAYEPPLSSARTELARGLLHGAQIKACVVYDRPFWRETGLSGYVLSDSGPVQNVWDNTPASGGPGVLLCFIKGDAARELDATDDDALCAVIIGNLVSYFGADAAQARQVHLRRWHREPWILGCPGSLYPPGLLTACGPALREPVGRIHWSGTETATHWQGFMDGAVASGERAAAEVSRLLV
jgi:monoamine oxidase